MYFPVSGVEVFPLWPVLSAFVISLVCSMSGISGAFLLLPYQISVLGYVNPGVSATNQIFNILACPAGVLRYFKEGRLLLPLTLYIAIGTLPGVFLGAFLRITILAEVQRFMIFVGAVLLYLGIRMLISAPKGKKAANTGGVCRVLTSSWNGFTFTFSGQNYTVPSIPLILLSFAVGIIGGTYGIGGGAIMVPFLVAFFGLPVYAIAGASLFATFLTSVVGVLFYSMLAAGFGWPWAAPDWLLGTLLGVGGIFGMYLGASLQKYAPPALLRLIILAIILGMGINYVLKGIAG